ncbi:MAG: co-chaperone GroES [Nanoarchaeota archaeon]
MNITPYRETIFVLPDKVVDKTDSGIILTDYTKKRPTSGTIIAIGNKIEDFKIGDRIIYGEFSGAKHIINYNNEDTEIFIMTPNDILALLN